MAARRVLLSGYSGAGADIRMAEVSAEGRLRGGQGLRHGENPSFCCWMDGRVYAVAELPQGASVTAYALEGDALRPLGRMELPGRRGLCHLAAVDGVLYGSCYESGHYFALDAELSQAREKDHRVLNQSAGVLQGVYQLRGLPHRVVVLGKLYRGRHQLHLLHAGAGEDIRRLGADALNLPAELGGQLRNAVPVLALQILPGLFLQLIGNGHAHRVQGKGKNQKQHQKPPGQAVAQHGSPVFFSLHASCPSSLSRPVAERRLLRRVYAGFIVSWMRLFFIHPRARWAALRKKNARAVKHAAREAVSGKGKHAGGLVQRQNVLPRQVPAIPAV